MKEINIFYNNRSYRNRKRQDIIQLLIASFSNCMAYFDSIKDYTGLLTLLPIISFGISIVNIIIIKNYDNFNNKYGYKLETSIFRINGVIMLITALGFQFIGEHTVQLAYYFISLAYLTVIPATTLKVRKNMIINLKLDRIIIARTFFSPLEYLWQDIESIIVERELLQLKIKNEKKQKKYYLKIIESSQYLKLLSFLEQLKEKYNFSLDKSN